MLSYAFLKEKFHLHTLVDIRTLDENYYNLYVPTKTKNMSNLFY